MVVKAHDCLMNPTAQVVTLVPLSLILIPLSLMLIPLSLRLNERAAQTR